MPTRMRIITGKGLHSGPQGPVLRSAVIEYLRSEFGIEGTIDPQNTGVVLAVVQPLPRPDRPVATLAEFIR